MAPDTRRDKKLIKVVEDKVKDNIYAGKVFSTSKRLKAQQKETMQDIMLNMNSEGEK